MIKSGIAEQSEIDSIRENGKKNIAKARDDAWDSFRNSIETELDELESIVTKIEKNSSNKATIEKIKTNYTSPQYPLKSHLVHSAKLILRTIRDEEVDGKLELQEWHQKLKSQNKAKYSSNLYSNNADSALKIPEVKAVYSENSPSIDASKILNKFFDAAFSKNPKLVAFGEDVGKIGDVNQGFVGLQEKYGDLRVTDTGIREATIIGQAIGLAMRGLKPIAEIQYLDYIMYALQIMSDDLATVHYRSHGRQKAPVIIRTRGHRLQGVWHSGSPLGTLINGIRGIYICVPRNMTQAAGMYNTLIHSGDPALVIECLNGYRLKETLPDNIGEFTVPLGQTETL